MTNDPVILQAQTLGAVLGEGYAGFSLIELFKFVSIQCAYVFQ